jgi:hypothetical protein
MTFGTVWLFQTRPMTCPVCKKSTKLASIEKLQQSLDSEREMMTSLIAQEKLSVVDLVGRWKKGSVSERQELQSGLYPDGLLWSRENAFFEPRNVAFKVDVSLIIQGLQ